MKKILLLSVSFAFWIYKFSLAQGPDYRVAASQPGANFYAITDSVESWLALQDSTSLANSGFSIKNYERWKFMWNNRVDSIGGTPGNFDYVQNLSQKLYMQPPSACTNGSWTQLGLTEYPSKWLGIIVAVAVDDSDPALATVYAGSNSSGLWKTTNANDAVPQWTQLTQSVLVPSEEGLNEVLKKGKYEASRSFGIPAKNANK